MRLESLTNLEKKQAQILEVYDTWVDLDKAIIDD